MVRDASTPTPNGHDAAKSNGHGSQSLQDWIERDIAAGIAAGMTPQEARVGAYGIAEWITIMAEVERDNEALQQECRKDWAT